MKKHKYQNKTRVKMHGQSCPFIQKLTPLEGATQSRGKVFLCFEITGVKSQC
jgi:hypothetical protein